MFNSVKLPNLEVIKIFAQTAANVQPCTQNKRNAKLAKKKEMIIVAIETWKWLWTVGNTHVFRFSITW